MAELLKNMKTLISLTLCIAAYGESAADIKENTKRNAEYRKLAAATRVAMSKQDVFYTTWMKDCGRLDCIAKPQPQTAQPALKENAK